MSQSINPIEHRSTVPATGPPPTAVSSPEPDPAASRWKLSPRILQVLQEDRQSKGTQSDPWRSRSSPVPTRVKPKSIPFNLRESSDESSQSLTTDDRVPAWLISLIVHCVLVLLLALITTSLSKSGGIRSLILRIETTRNDDAALTLARPKSDEIAVASDEAAEVGEAIEEVPVEVKIQKIEVHSPVGSPTRLSASERIREVLGFDPQTSMLTSFSGGKLGDRSEDGRRAAVTDGSTSAQAEDSMELALRWIAEHQHNDGGWSFRLSDELGPCNSQCDNPIINDDDAPLPRTAATGLAMLAFMGAGYNHQSGPYSENLRRGIYYLRSQARETSLGIDLQNGSMYGHGIAALALAEAYALTNDKDLQELVEGTTFMCSGARHTSGGWGYQPGGPPDITLTGWQVIACKTAELKGIKIPTDVFPKAKSYLDTLKDELGVRYGYKTPESKLSTTAIGIVLQMYLGVKNQTEIREGLDYLADSGPSPTNVYYNYYAMLAMHHGRHWGSLDFAKAIRDHLIATQAQSGHEKGSWHFEDRYGSVGGRLYTTAMCCLILQTPYRYVPLQN